MKSYVFDSFALIGYFRNESFAYQIEELLVLASEDKVKIHLSHINLGEIYYIISRKSNESQAILAWNAVLQLPIILMEVDLPLVRVVSEIKSKYKLSFAAAIAAALAIRSKSILITGDKEFNYLIGLKDFKMELL